MKFLNVLFAVWTLNEKRVMRDQAAKMKVIIAGSRSIIDYEIVKLAVQKSGFTISEVVSGTCAGPDKLGERWAQENNIPIKRFPADWNKHGKVAGPIRNSEMVKYCENAIIIWDGISRGTQDTITKMQNANKELFIYVPNAE